MLKLQIFKDLVTILEWFIISNELHGIIFGEVADLVEILEWF